MTVKRVDALCECEGCGKRFGIELDIGRDLTNEIYPDFDAVAREEIRNGHADGYTWGVRGKSTVERFPLSGCVTIQADLMLCDICTRRCDDVELAEDRNLTRGEVNKALGLPGETT